MINGSVDSLEANPQLMVDWIKFSHGFLLCQTLLGFKMLLGIDIILKLGDVIVRKDEMKFLGDCVCAASAMSMEDQDYSVRFEDVKWVIKWQWNENSSRTHWLIWREVKAKFSVPVLHNLVLQYPSNESSVEAFEEEAERWISDDRLLLYEDLIIKSQLQRSPTTRRKTRKDSQN